MPRQCKTSETIVLAEMILLGGGDGILHPLVVFLISCNWDQLHGLRYGSLKECTRLENPLVALQIVKYQSCCRSSGVHM